MAYVYRLCKVTLFYPYRCENTPKIAILIAQFFKKSLKMACKTTLFFEKVCVKAEIFIPLHQQNPPRFSLDQRTRAGLLLYMSTIRLYTKQPLSIADQIQLLKDRGLLFGDETYAAKFLSEVSYFRFVP